jgi:hypothetical protein
MTQTPTVALMPMKSFFLPGDWPSEVCVCGTYWHPWIAHTGKFTERHPVSHAILPGVVRGQKGAVRQIRVYLFNAVRSVPFTIPINMYLHEDSIILSKHLTHMKTDLAAWQKSVITSLNGKDYR